MLAAQFQGLQLTQHRQAILGPCPENIAQVIATNCRDLGGTLASQNNTPKQLYKYRPFSARTISLLVEDRVYFADPNSFNDPLDTKPWVIPNLPVPDLEELLARLLERRSLAEMTAAARTIKYRGPKTIEHIARQSKRMAERVIAGISHGSHNPFNEGAPEEMRVAMLGIFIQEELLHRYDKGIFSLAARNNCPLMWSHYGDQHRGICIGYSVPDDARSNVHSVNYGGSRSTAASVIARAIGGEEDAAREMDESVLLRKAGDWRYEKEWRLFGQIGVADAPIELTDIYFGYRCEDTVKHTVVSALLGRDRPVKFYEMRVNQGTFRLRPHKVDVEALDHTYPRRARTALEVFDDGS